MRSPLPNRNHILFLLWDQVKDKEKKMTTLLQEFEEWLRDYPERYTNPKVHKAIFYGLKKLEELKKKHGIA